MDVSCKYNARDPSDVRNFFHSIEDFTAEHVYNMLMKNFQRVYIGEEDEFGFVQGNKAPWGLYMHAAWFFGNDWHYDGYKMFLQVKCLLYSKEDDLSMF